MRLTITKKNLVEVLSRCAPLTKQKTTSPILACVLLEADLQLTASATDLYQSVVARTTIDPHTKGACAVNAKDMLARVASFPEGPITLHADDDKLHVTAGKRKHKVPIVRSDEFPSIVSELKDGLTVPGKMLHALLAMARPAANEDPARPNINSVLLELRDGVVSTGATDGRRMHFVTETLAHGSPASMVVPLPSVDAILAILDKTKDATLATSTTDLVLRSGDVVYATKLVGEQFPPIREMLSRKGPIPFQIDSASLADSLRSVSLATADGALAGAVAISVTQDEMTLSGEGKGAATDTLPLLSAAPTPLTISASTPFLLAALSPLPPGPLTLTLGPDDLSPIYLEHAGPPQYTAVVMPLRR